MEKVGGVVLTVKLQAKFPEYTWIVAAVGVVLDGCSCFLIPWCTNYFMLMMPICILCFGIAMVDTALLPTLGYIVDKVSRLDITYPEPGVLIRGSAFCSQNLCQTHLSWSV